MWVKANKREDFGPDRELIMLFMLFKTCRHMGWLATPRCQHGKAIVIWVVVLANAADYKYKTGCDLNIRSSYLAQLAARQSRKRKAPGSIPGQFNFPFCRCPLFAPARCEGGMTCEAKEGIDSNKLWVLFRWVGSSESVRPYTTSHILK